mgnify:CR=1 FL=1
MSYKVSILLGIKCMDTKRCSRCHEDKSLDEFYVDRTRKNGRYPQCIVCAKAAKKRVRDTPEYREWFNEYRREWNKRNPDKRKAMDRRQALKKYGLTESDYEAMLASQEGRCAICKREPQEDGRLLDVDHCHDEGHVRGLLCSQCNVGIGMFRHSPELFRKAMRYLG